MLLLDPETNQITHIFFFQNLPKYKKWMKISSKILDFLWLSPKTSQIFSDVQDQQSRYLLAKQWFIEQPTRADTSESRKTWNCVKTNNWQLLATCWYCWHHWYLTLLTLLIFNQQLAVTGSYLAEMQKACSPRCIVAPPWQIWRSTVLCSNILCAVARQLYVAVNSVKWTLCSGSSSSSLHWQEVYHMQYAMCKLHLWLTSCEHVTGSSRTHFSCIQAPRALGPLPPFRMNL